MRGKPIEIAYSPFGQTVAAHLAFIDHRTVACVTGARGGKTTFGVGKVIDAAILQPGFDYDDIDRKEPYIIGVGAPIFPMLERVVLPALNRAIPKELLIKGYHGTQHMIKMRGRFGETWIYFLSCLQPQSWQGLKLYGAWIDEFPMIKETMYDEVQTRLSDRKGWLLLTGTPQGPNWAKTRIYDSWKQGIDPEISFHTWRTVDNPFIDRAFIERKRLTMPRKYFKRTFEASWDVFEGQIYEQFIESVHCKRLSYYTFVLPNGERVGTGSTIVKLEVVAAGVDWGYENPGSIVVGGLSAGRWWILEDMAEPHVHVVSPTPGADSWLLRAQRLRKKWDIGTMYCDTENPEYIQQFRKAGLPARNAVKDVQEGLQAVGRGLHIPLDPVTGSSGEPGMYFLEEARGCQEEILYYHWREGREAPEKIDDHCMDGLRYLVYSHAKVGSFKREPKYGAA